VGLIRRLKRFIGRVAANGQMGIGAAGRGWSPEAARTGMTTMPSARIARHLAAFALLALVGATMMAPAAAAGTLVCTRGLGSAFLCR